MTDSCKHGNEPLGSRKCVERLIRARSLLTSGGWGLCTVELDFDHGG